MRHALALKTCIRGVETANPPQSLTQQEIFKLLCRHAALSSRSQKLYEQFLSDDGISRRYFAWDDFQRLLSESVDDKMKRYERWAVRLSVEAVQRLLGASNCPCQAINAIFVSTCTGYLCPGLSTYISGALGLKPHIHTLDLVGLGCGGALPALRAADDYLHRYPDSTVLVVAAEICSAAVHWEENPELILSNSIFSDGAAAVLVTNRPDCSGLSINTISSLLWPQYREELRFKYLNARLCNVISTKVSRIVAEAIEVLYSQSPAPGTHFAIHSAGRKILDKIQARLRLTDENMRYSRLVLKEYGNMSSPSVLFALKRIFMEKLNPRDRVVCFAFGAGFFASMLQGEWQSSGADLVRN